MQSILYASVLFINFLFTSGLTQIKICVNCKFYMPDDKCGLFPRLEKFESSQVDVQYKQDMLDFLVNGKKVPVLKKKPESYYYCSTAREFKDMCGTEGSKYEPHVKK